MRASLNFLLPFTIAAGAASTSGACGEPEAPLVRNVDAPIEYPASRELIFDVLAGRIILACKLPDLQTAAELTEEECAERVRVVLPLCKDTARAEIPSETILAKEEFKNEFKVFIDCLIPPTESPGKADSLDEVLVAGRA